MRALRGVLSQTARGFSLGRDVEEEDKGRAGAVSLLVLRGSTQRVEGYDVKGLAVGRVFQKLRGVRRQSKIMGARLKDSKAGMLEDQGGESTRFSIRSQWSN